MTSIPAPRSRLLPRSQFRLIHAAVVLATIGQILVVLPHLAHAAQAVTDPIATGQAAVDGSWAPRSPRPARMTVPWRG